MKVARRSQVPPLAVMEILAAAKARRAAGEDVVILCAGEPSSGAPAAVRQAATALLVQGDLGYTEATGTPLLRQAIAAHYGRTYGIEVDPASVAVTTGSSGAFLLAFLAAFEAGDRVALARPGYPAYANILSALGCQVVDLPCGPEQRYQPTVAQLDAAGPLDGLVLASPANPTGTMVTPGELAAIARWCVATGTRLVSDEIYHGITYPGAPETGTAATAQGAVVVSSFSKLWGMTGWRLGWLVLPDDLVDPVGALAGNLALCPPSLAQHAALAAFSADGLAAARESTARYAQCRDLLLAARDELRGDPVAPADGAFYLNGNVAAFGLDSPTYCARLLDEAGVALTPGTDFDPAGGRDWVRLSFAVAPDDLRRAVDRIVGWQRGLVVAPNR
ncbi:MAG TPA: aminotransferase class I/II-fold pyridoxal phosphate-dependent enzyme [Rugosimonospora sp.]|nr:aminotransferase class I/II-fold pyridoxal phosphate-dependent enzyme [Rugosimonospora sp.]